MDTRGHPLILQVFYRSRGVKQRRTGKNWAFVSISISYTLNALTKENWRHFGATRGFCVVQILENWFCHQLALAERLLFILKAIRNLK